jgi:hypothetical protein
MFALTEQDLNLRIIGCADGPAGFNAHMFKLGRRMVSCDPLYQLTATEIKTHIDEIYDDIIGQTRQNRDQFVWTFIKSTEELGHIRMTAMRTFLADYDQGKRAGRYVAAELPDLPFEASSFDLALCSHFLFLYSDNLSLAFHLEAIEAMCRVAKEARIFPLLTYNAEPSLFAEPVVEKLIRDGYQVSTEDVAYEFQRGGNKMLRVSR